MYAKSLILALCTALGFTAQAQNFGLDKLKNKAGNALGNAIDRKIDSEMNKMADKMVNNYWDRMVGKYYQNAFGGDTGLKAFPFMLSDQVTLEDEYRFAGNIKMTAITYKKNGKQDNASNIWIHTAATGQYSGTQVENADSKKSNEQAFIINDFKNKAMVMLMDDGKQKTSMAFSLIIDENAIAAAAESGKSEPESLRYKNIGTKTIMGCTCDGYSIEDDESQSEIWASKECETGMEKMFAMQNYDKNKYKMPEGFPSGAIMETSSLDKKSGEKTVMQVVEINKSAALTKKMSDYPRMTFGEQEGK